MVDDPIAKDGAHVVGCLWTLQMVSLSRLSGPPWTCSLWNGSVVDPPVQEVTVAHIRLVQRHISGEIEPKATV
jgi:hypothetical protein